jgi:hypothetical protein
MSTLELILSTMAKVHRLFVVPFVAVDKETGKTFVSTRWTDEAAKKFYDDLGVVAVMLFDASPGILRAAAPDKVTE